MDQCQRTTDLRIPYLVAGTVIIVLGVVLGCRPGAKGRLTLVL
jgi:hypothetical protein